MIKFWSDDNAKSHFFSPNKAYETDRETIFVTFKYRFPIIAWTKTLNQPK